MNFYDVLAAEKWDGGIPTINFFDLLFAQSMGGGGQWETYEGTLPATLNANGDNMRQYQIYGNTGGVGDRTVNLLNYSAVANDLTLSSTTGKPTVYDGRIATAAPIDVSNISSVTIVYNGNQENILSLYSVLAADDTLLTRQTNILSGTTIEIPPEGTKLYIGWSKWGQGSIRITTDDVTQAMVYTTPPENYVPYGYEVDMVIRDTTTINIGNEPLCGIGMYIDSLNLSTGMLTRRIKKLVLTGKEDWRGADNSATKNLFSISNYKVESGVTCMSTHYSGANNVVSGDIIPNNSACFFIEGNLRTFYIKGSEPITLADFKSYLAVQYVAGTPVTVWYVLAEPEVSTIAVPSGLTGTIEGYLIQDGTPTAETPIYPTANGVKQADDTYSIKYSISSTITPIYIGNEPLGKDEYVDYQAGKIYRMINGVLTPTDPPVPLPALPTAEGETVVDYAGSGAEPEKVYFEYKGGKQP